MPGEWQLAWVKVRRIRGLQGGHEEVISWRPANKAVTIIQVERWLLAREAEMRRRATEALGVNSVWWTHTDAGAHAMGVVREFMFEAELCAVLANECILFDFDGRFPADPESQGAGTTCPCGSCQCASSATSSTSSTPSPNGARMTGPP